MRTSQTTVINPPVAGVTNRPPIIAKVSSEHAMWLGSRHPKNTLLLQMLQNLNSRNFPMNSPVADKKEFRNRNGKKTVVLVIDMM